MIKDDYVSLEVAKLLKEKGFNKWCWCCYGIDVRHNGESIDEDEEFELKDEGREDELEYVDGGKLYDFGCDNKHIGSPYAAPTTRATLKWIQETYNILIVADYDYEFTNTPWCFKVYRLDENGKPERVAITGTYYDYSGEHKQIVGYRDYERSYEDYATREEAEDDGIRYVLENYIS